MKLKQYVILIFQTDVYNKINDGVLSLRLGTSTPSYSKLISYK